MAQIKGLSETALIHLALANLARTTLPRYEPDDGPLTEEQLAAIRADVAKHAPGQWALIPWFAKERALKYSTNNARSEELLSKASYKDPWKRGQRCIIPATTFDEPCWESGKNVWWTFARSDGEPWGLAGLWNRWTDPATGEVVESYTMLTLNADQHPLMRRMHKPDPKLAADQQDKRSVIPIERADVDQWLSGTVQEALQLLRLAPVETFRVVS